MQTQEKPPDSPVCQASNILDIVSGTFLQRNTISLLMVCGNSRPSRMFMNVTLLRMRSSKKVCLVVTSQGQWERYLCQIQSIRLSVLRVSTSTPVMILDRVVVVVVSAKFKCQTLTLNFLSEYPGYEIILCDDHILTIAVHFKPSLK